MNNGSRRNAGTEASGVAKRRKGAASQPQRPFVVAANPSVTRTTPASSKTIPSVPTKPKAAFVVAAPGTVPEPVDGSLLRVTRFALARYLRNPWFAVDAVLVLALFFVGYRSSFDTLNFFASADFMLGVVGAIGAYGLVHGVVPPEQYLPLARVNGSARTVGGLTLAAVIIRTAYCLIFVGLALVFQRFYGLDLGALLAGWLGLIVACAVLATTIVCLSTPIAPRMPRIVALVVLVLGFASFNATEFLGSVLFVARIPLFPFIAPYRLAVAPYELLPWLGTALLAPAAIVGLILLGGFWLRRSAALQPTESAEDAPAQPVAVAR